MEASGGIEATVEATVAPKPKARRTTKPKAKGAE